MLRQKLMGSTGNEPAYIEDFFQTWLRTGTGASATVTTGLNASINKSLVWTKSRSATTNHKLTDTVRGATKALSSNTTSAEATDSQGLTAFSSTGYTIGTNTDYNNSGATYVDWQLIAQPKFFDVVTYTGNSTTGRQIAHNLGSTPGCIIVKNITTAGTEWPVYHNGIADPYLSLNTTNANSASGSKFVWGNDVTSIAPTSTVFTVGGANAGFSINRTGEQYVAYLFAHNAGGFGLTGTDNVISCGSYTGTGSTTGFDVTLGYEPQWVLVKRASGGTGNWGLVDNMRGFAVNPINKVLTPNGSNAEVNLNNLYPIIQPTATGFRIQDTTNADWNASSSTYIYIAIRRGPMKVPTDGTKVYTNAIQTTGTTPTTSTTGFPVDLIIQSQSPSATNKFWSDRLRGSNTNFYSYVLSNATSAEATGTGGGIGFDNNTGFVNNLLSPNPLYDWCFRRAPGFFDEVCYTGNSTAGRVINHNLGAAPELAIFKMRNDSASWLVYAAPLGFGQGLFLDSNGAMSSSNLALSAASSTTVTLTSNALVNLNTYTYVAYLFASCPGVSKIFSYTGNGSSQTINCGFTGGARFVLIKRTDSTGDWYVWDTARGIVAGNDPHLSLNTTAAEVTSNDTIDTDSTGFVVNQVAATNVNVSSATYIGLAIA
jgi:hypothetical protein